jgi:hypothetical protein
MRIVRGLTFVAAAGALACQDSTQSTRPLSQDGRRSSAIAANSSSLPATTVSFDVTVETTKAGANVSSLAFHIDRSRGNGNAWRTTITLVDDPRLPVRILLPSRLKRFVIDESGVLSTYRADGSLMPPPDPKRVPKVPPMPVGMKLPAVVAHPTTPQIVGGKVLGTGWIDELVMSNEARAQEAAKLASAGVDHSRDALGLDHYVRSIGTQTTETIVDSAAAVVRAVSVAKGGKLIDQLSYDYTSAAGVSIRRRSQLQISSGTTNTSRTLTLSNIIIDGQGVQ